mmetsp:Transcript_13723/g.39021  ORF Transcript_13723/g.39021 Transcript_13723/m.39021 type:complete len:259 (-) Transcript_13723:439-1215(-)
MNSKKSTVVSISTLDSLIQSNSMSLSPTSASSTRGSMTPGESTMKTGGASQILIASLTRRVTPGRAPTAAAFFADWRSLRRRTELITVDLPTLGSPATRIWERRTARTRPLANRLGRRRVRIRSMMSDTDLEEEAVHANTACASGKQSGNFSGTTPSAWRMNAKCGGRKYKCPNAPRRTGPWSTWCGDHSSPPRACPRGPPCSEPPPSAFPGTRPPRKRTPGRMIAVHGRHALQPRCPHSPAAVSFLSLPCAYVRDTS